MRTVVVSDLHLGSHAEADVARAGAAREALVDAVSGADRLVLLGDLVELREGPLATSLATARPLVEELGRVVAGREVIVAPGNHDHAFAEPWLTQLRLEGHELPAESVWPVKEGDGVAGRLAAWMPDVSLSLAYPGVWLRPDVYATHGHYLDLQLTVPRLESIAAAAMARVIGRKKAARSPAEYETVLAPLYAFYDAIAEGASPASLSRSGSLSRQVWGKVTGDDRVGRLLLGRVTIPGAVAALNRLGLGPFKSELTGVELRRSGLLAMGHVADALVPDAEHVIFGHTHRPGPLAGDDLAEWTTLSGTRLWNSGSWLHEETFVRDNRESPYWPGTVLTLEDEGPPQIRNVLNQQH